MKITLATRGLERVGKKRWRKLVKDVIERLVAATEPEDVVIGGGNLVHLNELPKGCRAGNNAYAFIGGFRMWNSAYASINRGRDKDKNIWLEEFSARELEESAGRMSASLQMWVGMIERTYRSHGPRGAQIYPRTSMRQRVRTHLDVHRTRHPAQACPCQPRRAVAVGAPQAASLPAGVRVIDAADRGPWRRSPSGRGCAVITILPS